MACPVQEKFTPDGLYNYSLDSCGVRPLDLHCPHTQTLTTISRLVCLTVPTIAVTGSVHWNDQLIIRVLPQVLRVVARTVMSKWLVQHQ